MVRQACLVLLFFWLPTQLQWMLPQEQHCLLILDFIFRVFGFSLLISGVRAVYIRVVDPYSFFTDPDPDPVDPDGGQYGSGYGSGSGSNPDSIRIQGFNDQKLKKITAEKKI